jgi:glycosyltransferase involved in cell wall biosynthesis
MRILIVIPALNEAEIIVSSLTRLRDAVREHLSAHEVSLLVVDNGSTDGTADAVEAAFAEDPSIAAMRINGRGKGLAVRSGWASAPADAFVFMDADLATDLAALPALISALDGADVAIGSRAQRSSVVERSVMRRMLSSGYRTFLRASLCTSIGDAACGFKAVTGSVVASVMPLVRDDGWFFDTELVIRAERAGCRIAEIPVQWREPTHRRSKVDVPAVVLAYVREVLRLRRELNIQ